MEIKINQMERDLPDGEVTQVHWTAMVEDGEFSASSYGSVGFHRTDESPAFVGFDDLTEDMVVGWVTPELPENLEENLVAQIAEQKAPTRDTGMPWVVEV